MASKRPKHISPAYRYDIKNPESLYFIPSSFPRAFLHCPRYFFITFTVQATEEGKMSRNKEDNMPSPKQS